MGIFQTIRVAIQSLTRNKMRSFLTTLGVWMGVAAVTAMVAVGEGAKATVEATYQAMGSHLLLVTPGSVSMRGMHGGAGSQATLTWGDLRAIQQEIPTVRAAAPALRTSAQVVSGEGNWSTMVLGTTPAYFDVRNWPISQGNGFAETEGGFAPKVAIVGHTAAKNLFASGTSPVGQTVRIRNIPFEVIGVAKAKGQSFSGQDYDDVVFIPVQTFQSTLEGGFQHVLSGVIFVGATSADTLERTETDIKELLRERHRLRADSDDDFSIRNLSELASAREEGTRAITTLLATVAAIALLVGGIGIMNIMLVSVTERTREIGIRMAVGATPHNILTQFLTEALTLSIFGGVLGVGAGVLAATKLAQDFGWPLILNWNVSLAALGLSVAVGVVFGLYPAQKASRTDPIHALRSE